MITFKKYIIKLLKIFSQLRKSSKNQILVIKSNNMYLLKIQNKLLKCQLKRTLNKENQIVES